MVAGAIGTLIPVGKASAIAAGAVTVVPPTAGATAEYQILFTHDTAGAGVGSTITVTFPTGTVLPATISKTAWFFGQDAAGAATALATKAAPVAGDPDVVVDPTLRTIQ